MRLPVEFRGEATQDLVEACEWYESERVGLGHEFLVAVAAAVSGLRREPARFQIVKRRTRRVLVKRFPYMLLFVVQEKSILITAVFHLKRNPQRWSDRVRERVVALEPMEAFA
jgi:plasmid stabilization system protein ParE